jgi:AcrR family transcriptional regulator
VNQGTEIGEPVRTRDRVRTRTALVDAAASLLAERGYAGASLAEIAARAGFTRGAVHHHFNSKEELFLAVLERRDTELLAGYGVNGFRAAPLDPAVVSQWTELHSDDRDETLLRLELKMLAIRDEAVRGPVVALERAAVAATTEHLMEDVGVDEVLWRYPPDRVATLLHLMSNALRTRDALGEDDAAELMSIFLELVREGSIIEPAAAGSAQVVAAEAKRV